MVKEDFVQYCSFILKNQKYFKNIKKIILLSPCEEQKIIFNNFFKKAEIKSLYINEWNLNYESKERADLIFAGNIFMYSDDPELWFFNITKSCKLFLIQDLIERDRSSGEFIYLGNDGDKIRFNYKDDKTTCKNYYNLDNLDKNILKYISYEDPEKKMLNILFA